MSQRLVGFSMHPRWVGSDLESRTCVNLDKVKKLLEPLRAAGLGVLEFVLNPGDPYWSQFEPLMDVCVDLGFKLSFHAPYQQPYTLAGFTDRCSTPPESYNVLGDNPESSAADIKRDYEPMLDIAAHYGPATIVVHGACSSTRPAADLLADTRAFLEWALDCYPSLDFALENLGVDPGRTKIGADQANLLPIMLQLNHPRLGICWDMGHTAMNHARAEEDFAILENSTPELDWLRQVRHVHLHDLSERGVDHYPLMYGRVPYRRWLNALVVAGFVGTVVLEIKGHQLAHLELSQILSLLWNNVADIAGILEGR